MRMNMLVTGMLTALLISGPAFSASPQQITQGRTLSTQLCASCHQVTTAQRRPMRVYNPKTHEDQATLSFMEMAQRNGRDAHFVSDILDQPHYPMRKSVLRLSEKENIIAYIQSLENPR